MLPILIKGKIHERIASLGDGWFAPVGEPAELRTHLDKIRTECDRVDREFGEIEITCMWPGSGGHDAVAALEEAGAHRLVVPVMALGADPVAGISKLAEDVIG